MLVGGVAAGGAGIVGMTIGGACVIIIGAATGAGGATGRILGPSSAMMPFGAMAVLLFVLSVTLAERGLSGELFWLRRSPAAGAILYSHMPQEKTESVISDVDSLEAKAVLLSTNKLQPNK